MVGKRAFGVSEGSVTRIVVVRFSLSVPVGWVVVLFRNRVMIGSSDK